jgi:hypothetical protein
VRHRLRWLLTPPAQVRLAQVLLVTALVGWPLSALTIAREEPQVVLGLSWLALILTAHNTLVTSVTSKKVHENGEG